MSPSAILAQAKMIGLKALSFTDHESLIGYYKTYQLAQKLNLDLLPGIEMVTSYKGQEIHLLGYNFDPNHPKLISKIQTICQERNTIAKKTIERLQKLGFTNISWEQLIPLIPTGGVAGKNHILHVLREARYIKTKEQTYYFLRQYLAPGGQAYIHYEGNPLPKAIDLIHNANGIAVLAHPGLIRNQDLLKPILEENLDGLEVFYYYWGNKRKELIQYFYKIARERNLLITGGTDFHGIYSSVKMGSIGVSSHYIKKIKEYSYRKTKPTFLKEVPRKI